MLIPFQCSFLSFQYWLAVIVGDDAAVVVAADVVDVAALEVVVVVGGAGAAVTAPGPAVVLAEVQAWSC